MEIHIDEPQPIIDAYELTPDERKEFDYLDTSEIRSWDDAQFVRRNGQLYDLGEFMDAPPEVKAQGWHGFSADTFFSGILIKIIDDDTVQTALLLS